MKRTMGHRSWLWNFIVKLILIGNRETPYVSKNKVAWLACDLDGPPGVCAVKHELGGKTQDLWIMIQYSNTNERQWGIYHSKGCGDGKVGIDSHNVWEIESTVLIQKMGESIDRVQSALHIFRLHIGRVNQWWIKNIWKNSREFQKAKFEFTTHWQLLM